MLSFASLTLGLLLIVNHLFALMVPDLCKKFLQHFPRSRFWGTLLLSISGIWAFILVTTVDLGEFSPQRYLILFGIVLGTSLFWWLVPDFLAVRSLGFLGLLSAYPMLQITFLQSGFSPLALSLLAYIWIVTGLFLVGMPYCLRNIITNITKPVHHQRWTLLCYLGILYGAVLVVGGIVSFNDH